MATPRRNGQLSSCEPCRKSKLRCDHRSPVCGRCLNGRAERCFYHPSPLTQPRTPRVISRRPKRQRADNQLVFRVDQRISSTAAPSPSELPVADVNSLCDQHIARWTAQEKRTLRPGALGLVSPKDLFSEYEDSLPVEEPGRLLGSTVATTACPPSDSNQVLLGAQILSHLQKIRWFYEIIESKDKLAPGWVLGPPLTRALCHSIEQIYDSAVRGSQDTHASLFSLSRQIFANTSADIRTTSTMYLSEYFDSIAARWETIGLVFVLLGTALFHIPDDDPIFTHRNPWKLEKSQLRSIAITVSETCWQFCNGTGTASDAFCWLTTQQLCLLTMMVGYSDYRVWQKLGDLSTIIYGFGLHQAGGNAEQSVPFFLVELRKRVMACAIPLPLDITYDAMVGPQREGENGFLDANGWNTEGILTVGARLRVALLTSLLRESILELSLSPNTKDIPVRVEKLIQESRQTQQDLPSFMHWSPEQAAAGVYNSPRDEGRAFAHTEFMYQEFLLHRILLKRVGIASQGLIESSLDIITTLVDTTIAIQTRAYKSTVEISWDMCYIGLPAAGILTSKLLSEHRPQITSPFREPLAANIRKLIIQKLGAFVSHLTFQVQPYQGNYQIVQQGATYIRWVLDKINAPKCPRPAPLTSDNDLPENWLDDCDSEGNPDFMAWFDNIQWSQDSLLNFT
ncbi:uncharacterized protein N7446_001770 [Penicillium canescens]|uniref:Zn(2)-C6 fungal-type domain-containing protein n=1 Tax=Penicillium canescens TaxID=5083 RepID=A0AAD6N954_PENCN|nr:uncharacterized protein N7446_001770 [Penicillium canescens]KAJ6043572.1 hypothetical protein N7460_004927 [Penicillium canescens]KAJ6055046.1 hypothetical protein N7444_004144 [Penicillium canescens]KAJ6073993.1 hypothetical protein N7446_001770 [Penicillium canescens]